MTDPGKCPVKRVQWRALPAHRKGKRPPIIMQNVDSATYFGADKFGAAQCVEEAAEEQNDAIHLQLEADPETGLAYLVNPHWHFERGAPFVLRGVGKTETDRTVSEVRQHIQRVHVGKLLRGGPNLKPSPLTQPPSASASASTPTSSPARA